MGAPLLVTCLLLSGASLAPPESRADEVRAIIHADNAWIDDLEARYKEGAQIMRQHLAAVRGTIPELRLLAKCDFGANQYAACVGDCDRILARKPSDAAALSLKAGAKARTEAVAAMRPSLHPSERCIQAEPLDHAQSQWVVVTSEERLLRSERGAKRWRLLQDASWTLAIGGGVSVREGPALVLMVNRKPRIPEIAVVSYLGDTSGGETCDLQVWQLHRGKLRWAGRLPSNDCIFVGDLDQDGHWEYQYTHEIGEEMCHAEQPRWHDVYSVRGGRLVQVDAEHPKLFAPWVRLLKESLAIYPDDLDLWAYYGKVQRILGSEEPARIAYRQMVARGKWLLRHPNGDVRSDLRDRIKKLEAYARRHRTYPKARAPFWMSDT